jgi:hypothetical protein
VLHLGLDPIQEPEENDQTPPRGDIPREVSSKEDNSNANVPSRYDTSSKDKEYQKTALKLAAEMKRNKAMEQEVGFITYAWFTVMARCNYSIGASGTSESLTTDT